MPHEWWHRTDVVDKGWDAFRDYVVPVGQEVLADAVQLPVVKQTLQGLEAIHQKGVVPTVSAPLQYLPVEWQQDEGVEPAPWYRPDLRFQQGRLQPTFDAYMKPEGGVSPSAVLDAFTTFAGPGIARDVAGEWFNFETNPQDTIRAKRIDEVAQQREAETGKPLTQRERREIGSDIYKLPPYTRGIAEELPYLAVPPARVARTALQGARAGQALSTTGRLGQAAPLARGALRGAEMALKPVELFERGAERAITAPFRATGAGIGAARRGIQNLLPDQPAGPRDTASLYGVQPIGVEEARRNLMRQIENQQAREAADVARGTRVEPEVVTEPIETTVGISATVEPDQGFTKYFSPEDYGDWGRAKEILGEAYTYQDAPLLNWRDLEWAQETIDRLATAGRNRVSQKLTDDGFEAVVESNSGLFGGVVEPSIVVRASVPDNQLDDFTRTVVELADTEFNQRNVIVHSPEPTTGNTYGRTSNASTIGETLEPAVSIRFSRPLTQEEIQKYGLRYVDIEKEVGLSGYGGFAVHPDRQGLDVLNLTVYNDDYPKYVTTVDRFVGELINDGLGIGQTLERSTRKVRTIGEGGDGITSYANYRGYHDSQRGPTSRFRDEPDAAPAEPATAESVAPRAPPANRPISDIYGVGEASQQPQAFIRRRQARGDNGHAAIEDSIATLVRALPRNFTSDTVTDLSKKLLNRFPNIATGYVEFMAKYWDSAIALRILEDSNFRSAHPNALFNVANTMKVPVADRVVRATGAAVARASMRYTNFMRDTIEPFLARGATVSAIERYAQAKHWLILSQKARLQGRQLPDLVDPVTLEKIKVTDADLLNWTDRSWLRGQGFSDDAVDAVEKGAESIRNFYAEQRKRLLDEGIISQERFDSWRTEYPWYNPIQYLEFSDLELVKGFGGGMNVTTDGIFALSPTANTTGEALGALPPLGEVMLKNIIGTELRITRNKVTRDVLNMAVGAEIGLKDVSKEFTRQVTKTEPDGTKVTTTELSYVPYDDINKVGYLSFYNNGERVVYGGINSVPKDPVPIPKWLWDTVNGRSGLALRSTDEVMQTFGMANGFFRSVYTTYNPLFFIRNGIIDSLTVMLKAGVLPTSTAKRLMVNVYKAAKNSENRLIEVSQGAGAMSDRYYDVSGNYRRLTQELAGATTKQDGTIVSPNDTSGKKLNKILRDTTNPSQSWVSKAKRFIPAAGSIVEQAPRLAVTEKAIQKYIGKKEWNRLMGKNQDAVLPDGSKIEVKGLDKSQFNDEMLNNWTPQFDEVGNYIDPSNRVNRGALVDADEMQRAAQNGVEATLDFSRGGDRIRRWNNYVLFLNAAMEGFKLPFRTLGINFHPVIKPVKNPTEDGPQFEFGSLSEQAKNALPWQGRGVTGRVFDGVAGGPRGAALRIAMAVSTYWGIQTYWNKQFTYEGTPLYYDIPTYIRYNSIIFMLDSERDEFGDYILDPQTNRPVPRYIAIPHRLREWNLIFQSATLLDEETDKEVPMDKSKLGWELWKSTSPVSDIPMPELINAGLEEWQGYDFFRQAPIVDEELQGEPLEDQYNQWTSETARRAAGILDDVPAPDLIGDIIGSPQRLDHLYENVTGGAGKIVTSMSDYAFRVADELRGVEERPMEARVEEYRDMTRRERTEFRASLTEEEYKEFQREIRMPKKETPFWDSLIKSYYPQKSGGLYELSSTMTEEATGVSVEETRKAGQKMGEVRIKVGHDQQRNDTSLSRWVNREPGTQLSPKDWREEKSKKWSVFEGAELALGEVYQKSVQNRTDEEKDAYYTYLYNAAGQMQDIRTGADLLMAAYYSIEPEDSTETGVSNTSWSDFFAARKQYLDNIRLASEASGDGMYDEVMARLKANMTPTEVAYDNSRQLLSSYWDAGRTVTELYPNISPQYQQVWDNYLNADSGRRNAIYNESQTIQLLVKKRSELRKQILLQDSQQRGYPAMELALVFWYGDFYDQPITPEGKHYYNKLYVANSTQLKPVSPIQGPQLPAGVR